MPRGVYVRTNKMDPEVKLERYRAKKRAYMAKRRAEKPDVIKASKKRWADANREYLAAKFRERYRLKHPKAAKPPVVTSKYSDDLYARIHKLVSRHIDKDRRDDIVTDIYIGVLEGVELTAEYVKLCVKQYNKQFSQYDTVSLDAVMTGGQSRGQIMGVY